MTAPTYLQALEESAQRAQLGPFEKGLGRVIDPLPLPALPALGWSLLAEDLSLPCAVLYESRLAHNLRWMQDFVRAYGLNIAPHGKTTMAPALFQRQLDAGAWGITVATAQQALVAAAHGVRRVLIANQLIGRRNLEMVAEVLASDAVELYCLVDSAAGVEQLGRFFAARAQSIDVLVELGAPGGRTGVRHAQELEAVLAAQALQRGAVRLAGVELYEGVLDVEADVRAFLRRAAQVTLELARARRFDRTPPLLSGAGSAWYDVVAEEFGSDAVRDAVQVVLRPGCYLSHDAGVYRVQQALISERNPVARTMGSNLLPALQVWAHVQSLPEPGLAIVGLGKRDAAFDAGLPQPALHYRPGDERPRPAPQHLHTLRMMDQHAFLRTTEGDDLRVGDMLAFDISHPCLTFDKWRYIPVLDDAYRVVEIIKTYF